MVIKMKSYFGQGGWFLAAQLRRLDLYGILEAHMGTSKDRTGPLRIRFLPTLPRVG